MSLPGQPDAGQTQYKILQAAPGGYLVDFGDGTPVLVPESSLVDQGEVNPTPGMYEQQAQFGGSRQRLAPQAALDEAAAYTEQLHQQYPGSAGGAPAQGPTPTVANAPVGAPRPPMNIPMPFGQTYSFDFDPNNNSGQPAPDSTGVPDSYSAGMRQGESQSYGHTGVTDHSPYPVMPDLSSYEQKLGEDRQGVVGAYDSANDALGTQQQLLRDQAADPRIQELQAAIPADVKAQQARMAAIDEVANEYVKNKNDEIMHRMAAVPQEDPSRIWSDMPAWQSALGLLSAVTGGMLAVTTGSGKNMGLEAIERAIQRDVEAQRTNIDNEWKKIAHDENSLESYRKWKANEKQDMLAEGIIRREALNYQLETEKGKYSSLSKIAELDGLKAGNTAKQMEAVQEYDKLSYDHAFAQGKELFDQDAKKKELSIQSTNAATSLMNARTAAHNAGVDTAASPTVQIGYDQRTKKPIFMDAKLYDVHKTSVKDILGEYRKAGDFLRQAQQLKTIYEALGPGVNSNLKNFGSELRDQANSLKTQLAYELAGINDKGQKSKQDIASWEKALGDAEQYHRRGGVPQLELLISNSRDKKQGLNTTYGLSDAPTGANSADPSSFLSAQTDIKKPTTPVVHDAKTAKVDIKNAAVGALTEEDPEQLAANMLALLNVSDNDDPSGELANYVDNALNGRQYVSGKGLAPKEPGTLGSYSQGAANVRQATADGVKRAEALGQFDVADRLKIVGKALEQRLLWREKQLSGTLDVPLPPVLNRFNFGSSVRTDR